MLCRRLLTSVTSVNIGLPVISQLNVRHHELQSRMFHSNGCSRQWQHSGRAVFNASDFGNNSNQNNSYCTGVVNSAAAKPETDNGLFKRVLNRVGFTPNTKTRLRVASHLLYESVADKINYLTFFHDFKMPNTFNSWFLVTELHVWMLLVRSMAEGAESGQDGRFLRNCIVEAMWGDVNTRAKKLGANNASRTRKQIEILSEQFQAALISYDEGVMADDRILAASLWRRFFEMDCDDYEQIERLVKYVRQNTAMLDGITREGFLHKPKIPWIDLQTVNI